MLAHKELQYTIHVQVWKGDYSKQGSFLAIELEHKQLKLDSMEVFKYVREVVQRVILRYTLST